MTTRRDFMKHTTQTAAFIPFMNMPFVGTSTDEVHAPLSVSIFSKHLQFLDCSSAAEAAAEIGFNGLDLTVRPGGHVEPASVKADLPDALKKIRSAGGDCSMITTSIESIRNPVDVDIIRTAAGSGIRYYRTNWFKYPADVPLPETLKKCSEQIKGLSELSRELRITGCYQNHAGKDVGSSFWEVHEILNDAVPSGEAKKITNDLNTYGGSSVTDDRKKICAVQTEREMYMYHVPGGEAKRASKITRLRDDGMAGLSVSADNRLYYVSRQGGVFDIWSATLTGEEQVQVTNDASAEQFISVTPDGKTLLFSSARSGIPNIWSIGTDGNGLKQLTKDAEDYYPSMDVSGKWIIFSSWMRGPNTVMKIPAGGGERSDVTTENGNSPVLSSDGTTVYFVASSDGRRYVSSIPVTGGTVKRLFEAPKNMSTILLRPNTNEISYLITTDGVSNVFTRPADGGQQKQFTQFEENFIASFAWTPDGKSVVVTRGELRSDVVLLTDESQ